ncbi:MAG TPA: RNA polymerase sigma factor [Candidatus Limnocylindrales bacterium]|nr:RNA polymerase sigma factor [Candidatus Limnocylindrales bacterium]
MARAVNIPEALEAAAAMPQSAFEQDERDTFTALYRAHHPALLRFALHMTGDRDAAAEVTQDVFVWLIHHRSAFDPARGELAAFLTGVARKVIQRRERTLRRWLPFSDFAPPRVEMSAAVDRELESAGLRKAIASLPVRYREVIVLCDLEGRSYEEAARLLGCAIGTLRSRLHRGRELLIRKFQPGNGIRP